MRAFCLGILFALTTAAFAVDKTLMLIAGSPSHNVGEHEHRAGCLLFQKCLAAVPGLKVAVYSNGWPTIQQDGATVDDNAAFEKADAVVFYSDGGKNHPALVRDHLEVLRRLIKRGAGLGCIHYATEPTKEKGEAEFLDWIGGAFEADWSVNPVWQADFKTMPDHEVVRGVRPFSTEDEWYFHLRFRSEAREVTPILMAKAPGSTMRRPDGDHSGNPSVRETVARGDPQTVMWVVERADGGRGFGFTGGHYHANWKNDDQRKIVLNVLLWLSKIPVPETGVVSSVSQEEIEANLDLNKSPATVSSSR